MSVHFKDIKKVYESNKSLNTSSTPKKRTFSLMKFAIDMRDDMSFTIGPSMDPLPLEDRVKLLSMLNVGEEAEKVISDLMFMLEEKDKQLISQQKEITELYMKQAQNQKNYDSNSAMVIEHLNQQIKELYDKNAEHVNEIENIKMKYESMLLYKSKENEELENEVASLSKKLEGIANSYESLYNETSTFKEQSEIEFNKLNLMKRKSENINADLKKKYDKLKKKIEKGDNGSSSESDSKSENEENSKKEDISNGSNNRVSNVSVNANRALLYEIKNGDAFDIIKETKKIIRFSVDTLNEIEVLSNKCTVEYTVDVLEKFDIMSIEKKVNLVISDILNTVEIFGLEKPETKEEEVKTKEKVREEYSEERSMNFDYEGITKESKPEIKIVEKIKPFITEFNEGDKFDIISTEKPKEIVTIVEKRKPFITEVSKGEKVTIISTEKTKEVEKIIQKIKPFTTAFANGDTFNIISTEKPKEKIQQKQNEILNPNQIISTENSSAIDSLFIENEYLKYILNHSISFSQICSILSTYFYLLINNSLFKTLKKSFPISLLNDMLKEFFFILYNNKGQSISNLSSILYETNLITLRNKAKSNNFYPQCENYDVLQNKNKKSINDLIHSYENESKKCIEGMLSKCSTYLNFNDAIEINKCELYKFTKSDNDNTIFTIKSNTLEIDLSLINYESLEYLLSKEIRNFNLLDITKIKFSNTIANNSPNILSQLLSLLTLPKLNHLSFNNTHIDYDIQNFICQSLLSLPNITKLSIKASNANDITIDPILSSITLNKKQISHLNLCKNSLSDPTIVIINKLMNLSPMLSSLNLSHNKIADKGLQALFNYQIDSNHKFTKLNIGYNNFKTKEFFALSTYLHRNPNTECINISGNELSMEGAIWIGDSFDHLKIMKKIVMGDMKITSEMLPAILKQEENNFEEMNFDNNIFGEVGDVSIARMMIKHTKIKKIFLRNTMVSSYGIEFILNCINMNKSSNLSEIHIENNNLNEEAVKKINEFTTNNKKVKVFQ